MLEQELKGESYDPREYTRSLLGDLAGFTEKTVSSVYQGISAILLIEKGMPSIDNYKPSMDYQRHILPDVVGAQLARRNQFEGIIENINQQLINRAPNLNEILENLEGTTKAQSDHKYLVEPPKPKLALGDQQTKYDSRRYRPRKVDYLAREVRNRNLGQSGEEFVLNYEKAALISSGKASLAEKVIHASKEDDSLGYDIRSYEKNGKDRFIEVKTTNYTRYAQFYVTNNEVKVSEKLAKKYYLYRVFHFGKAPSFFRMKGSLDKNFKLDPSAFTASLRR